MKINKMMEIVEYLRNLTSQLRHNIMEIFLKNLDISKELKIGATGEPTTFIDQYAEDFLIDGLSRFNCKVMSEEVGIKNYKDRNDKLMFIIDPIDGTSNAKKKLPLFSCSIALTEAGNVIVGIVRDSYNGDFYYAIKGQGSYHNEKRIFTSPFSDISKTMFILSRPISEKDFEFYKKIFFKVRNFRIFGCISLELCYIASSKAHAIIQIHEKPRAKIIDIAAAQFILKEAEGEIFDEKGKEIKIIEDMMYRTNFIACSNDPEVRRKILELLTS